MPLKMFPDLRIAYASKAICIFAITILSGCSSLTLPSERKKPDFLPEYLFHSKKKKAKYYAAYDKTLKLFDTPYKEIDINTRYGPAHVIVSGPENGQPLVLLHGMDASSTMWYPNIKAFSKTHRVYAVDYIMDAGKSVLKTGPLNNEQILLFYCDVFEKLKLDNIDILGTSRGGWIATLLAVRPNIKIRKLVLMSPAQVLSMVDIKIFPAIIFKIFPSRKQLKKTLAAFAQHPENIDQAFKDQFYIASKYGNSQAQVTRMMPFSSKELESLSIPVLVLVGDHDIMNGEKAIAKAKEHIKDVKIETVEDSGHFMSTDQSEKVNKLVTDFLN